MYYYYMCRRFRFDDRMCQLEQLDRQLQRLHDSCRQLWEQRRLLAHHTANQARAMGLMAKIEQDGKVAKAMGKLALVQVYSMARNSLH